MSPEKNLRQSVKAGIGVAILSRRAIRDDLICGSSAEVAIKGINFTRPFYLVRRKKRQPSPTALFLDLIRGNAAA